MKNNNTKIYRLIVRLTSGSLAIVEGYDEAIKFLEEEGHLILYIIREEFIAVNDWHRKIR